MDRPQEGESMKRESPSERAAWTALVEGTTAAKPSKYGNERMGKYASKREEAHARLLAALASRGLIKDLKEQDRIVLVPRKGKLRAIVYVADFTYTDLLGAYHVVDAKGFKTQVYRLKKRLAALLLNLEIEEV
jgi:hypothetical protein